MFHKALETMSTLHEFETVKSYIHSKTRRCLCENTASVNEEHPLEDKAVSVPENTAPVNEEHPREDKVASVLRILRL